MDYTLPQGFKLYCPNCGQPLEAGSRFCRKCGAQNLTTIADLVAQTPVAPATPTPAVLVPEEEIFWTRPAFYRVAISYAVAALLSLGVTVLIGYFNGSLTLVFAFTALFFVLPVWRHLKRNATRFRLTNHKIEIEYGLFSKTLRHIPVQNVQDVTVRAGLVQRMLSLGDVIIDSASVAGKIQMTNVHQPRQHADMILAQLPRKNF
jgi:membrane protein YdbS with pleckstrin-like domain